MNRRIATPALLAAGLALGLAACAEDDRGFGDAGTGAFNDGPVFVRNMPNSFMNVAFACVGANGFYTHTRAASPVIVASDPNCVEGGYWDSLQLEEPDQFFDETTPAE